MPMYFPDLKSVAETAELMASQKDENKRYKGIIPTSECQLPQAREELGRYFREVWRDEISALEVEMTATPENYHEVMAEGLKRKLAFMRGVVLEEDF